MRADLKAMPREILRTFMVEAVGAPRYRADQVFTWLHRHGARGFDAMTNLPAALRETLADGARIGGLALDGVLLGEDGTRKLLLRSEDGQRVESVLIPMDGHLTQCVSSQVGCKVGCAFCLTGRMPVRRDLSASEIVDQVLWAASVLTAPGAMGGRLPQPPPGDGERVTNLVFMGMGEPLDNYDAVVAAIRVLLDDLGLNYGARRVTVSTSGHVPHIARLGAEVPVGLAVSLNATTDEQRSRLMPLNRRWGLDALLGALRAFPLPPRRRITIEYVLLRGVNDTDADAARLIRLLRSIPCKINLIPFNPWPGAPFARPTEAQAERFGAALRDAHYNVTIRASRGRDIGAACGQLDGAAGLGEAPGGSDH